MANRDISIESALPVVSANGLNTSSVSVDFTASPSVALPATTTIGGSSVVALASVTGTQTTGATFSVTNTGVYTGVGADQVIANSATTGVVSLFQGNGLTTGTVISAGSTGTLVTTGSVASFVANSATTATGLVTISGTGLTTGSALSVTGGGSNMTAAGTVGSFIMGAATVGTGILVTNTGVYTGTTGIITVTANSATTGSVAVINGTGLTTGKGITVNATAATLTTGFYFAANDGTSNVFTIGSNGHITSVQTTAPTIAVTTQNGITAAAVTAGSSDIAGNFTTTGTSTGSSVITVTFNKTFTVAPKTIDILVTNAAAASPNSAAYVPAANISATAFQVMIPPGGTYAANPSYAWNVVA